MCVQQNPASASFGESRDHSFLAFAARTAANNKENPQ
jgi:hypothetical protein